jgi:ATP-dependent Clp protease protease subunit
MDNRMKFNDEDEVHSNRDSKYFEYYVNLAQSRVIFLSEEITKSVASTLSALLLHYDNESHDDIVLYINSPGGDAAALVNIYDTMKLIKSPINTVNIGKAYSAAALILCAGTKGKRFITKNANVMIHGLQCMFPMTPLSDQKDSEIYYDFLTSYNDIILNILAKHSRKSIKRIKKDCERDLYLNAQEALQYGIVDFILR